MTILVRMVKLNPFDQDFVGMAGSFVKHPNHQVIKGYDTAVKISKVRSSRQADSFIKTLKAPGYRSFFSSTCYFRTTVWQLAGYSVSVIIQIASQRSSQQAAYPTWPWPPCRSILNRTDLLSPSWWKASRSAACDLFSATWQDEGFEKPVMFEKPW
jgi:hypothetical protein